MYTWLITALLGWFGTKWPSGGDDGWPPNCICCGGIIGAASAVLVSYLAAGHGVDGFFANAVISLVAGNVGNQIVGSIVGLVRK